MGACLVIHRFPGNLSQVDLAAKVTALKDEMTYRYGHDPYNGTIATMNGPVVFVDWNDVDEESMLVDAEDLIANVHRKWQGPVAVLFDSQWHVGGWAAE